MSEHDDPRERVRKRLAQMADAAAFAAAASVGACAGSGDHGYGVVDPLPPPYMCPAPDDEAVFIVVTAVWQFDTIILQPQLEGADPNAHLFPRTPTASGGVLVRAGDQGGVPAVFLEAPGNQWPETVDVTFVYPCSTSSGPSTILTFVVRLSPGPVHSGNVAWQRVPTDDGEDAGR